MSQHREHRTNKDRGESTTGRHGRGRDPSGSSSSSQRGGKVTSHERAAFHHETAAHHHQQAAKHTTAGNHTRSELHADAARGHGRRAAEHGDEATREGGSGGPDRDREVNRHSLSQPDDRSRADRGQEEPGDEGDEGDNRDLGRDVGQEGVGGRRGRLSADPLSRDEGDDSERQSDDDDLPVNGRRRHEGGHEGGHEGRHRHHV